MEKEMIRALRAEPGKEARIVHLPTDLAALQRAVGGNVEPFFPFPDEDICGLCNDEGKLNGMFPNRTLKDDEGKIWDVVFGPVIFCGLGREDFVSLTDDQIKKCMDRFRWPERVWIESQELKAESYRPARDRSLDR